MELDTKVLSLEFSISENIEKDDCISKRCSDRASHSSLSITGLFAGVGGLEEGFRRRGHQSVLLCEADPAAQRVLKHHFPGTSISSDVRELTALPRSDVVTAGFPCQDLSQVGRRKGIDGPDSGLVGKVFELLRTGRSGPRWLVLENVPFMLKLDQGRGIRTIVEALEGVGWAWAYRTIDARAFGLPQRRRRVILLASREADPRSALFGADAGAPPPRPRGQHACGFYWTEGNTGLGWAVDAIPPLKGGSGLHIPSPPAIWFPRRRLIALPTIEDAERLQGFSAGWTKAAELELGAKGNRQRWRMVGNAVSVPLAEWLSTRLQVADVYDASSDPPITPGKPWPDAGWGVNGERGCSGVSEWPVRMPCQHLAAFLKHETRLLSRRAAAGFLSRLERSRLHHERAFRDDLHHHVAVHDIVTFPARCPSDESPHGGDEGTRQRLGAVVALRAASPRPTLPTASAAASG